MMPSECSIIRLYESIIDMIVHHHGYDNDFDELYLPDKPYERVKMEVRNNFINLSPDNDLEQEFSIAFSGTLVSVRRAPSSLEELFVKKYPLGVLFCKREYRQIPISTNRDESLSKEMCITDEYFTLGLISSKKIRELSSPIVFPHTNLLRDLITDASYRQLFDYSKIKLSSNIDWLPHIKQARSRIFNDLNYMIGVDPASDNPDEWGVSILEVHSDSGLITAKVGDGIANTMRQWMRQRKKGNISIGRRVDYSILDQIKEYTIHIDPNKEYLIEEMKMIDMDDTIPYPYSDHLADAAYYLSGMIPYRSYFNNIREFLITVDDEIDLDFN